MDIAPQFQRLSELTGYVERAHAQIGQGASLVFDAPAANDIGMARMLASIDRQTSPRVDAAATHLTSARDLINNVPIGDEPDTQVRTTVRSHVEQALLYLTGVWQPPRPMDLPR